MLGNNDRDMHWYVAIYIHIGCLHMTHYNRDYDACYCYRVSTESLYILTLPLSTYVQNDASAQRRMHKHL